MARSNFSDDLHVERVAAQVLVDELETLQVRHFEEHLQLVTEDVLDVASLYAHRERWRTTAVRLANATADLYAARDRVRVASRRAVS